MAGWDNQIFGNLPPRRPVTRTPLPGRLPGSPYRPALPPGRGLRQDIMPVDPGAVVGGLYEGATEGAGNLVTSGARAVGLPSPEQLGHDVTAFMQSPTFGGGASPMAGAGGLMAAAPIVGRVARATGGARTAEEIARGVRATEDAKAVEAARPASERLLDQVREPTPATDIATGGKLFDYSGLNKVPDVPQFDLPRYTPPRGVPARIGDLTASPDVRQGMLDTIQRGVQMGGADWYNAEPLRQHFISELGDAEGNQRFQQYMDMVAATSPRSDVGTNVRNASYYYNRLVNGEPMPEVGAANPQPYGHMAQRLHQMNAQRVAGGGWDPLNNPKPASFVQDLVGNQQPVAVDTHAFRLPGMLSEDPRFLVTDYQSAKDAPKQNIQQMVLSGQMSMEDALKQPAYWQAQPKANEYQAMEQYYQGLARDQGLSPAQAQAAAWVGGGQTTGLASDASKPFIGFVEDRANKTADVRGLSPAEALSQFIRGKAPLLGVGAGAAATAPLWQQFQQYQQPQGGGYGQPSA